MAYCTCALSRSTDSSSESHDGTKIFFDFDLASAYVSFLVKTHCAYSLVALAYCTCALSRSTDSSSESRDGTKIIFDFDLVSAYASCLTIYIYNFPTYRCLACLNQHQKDPQLSSRNTVEDEDINQKLNQFLTNADQKSVENEVRDVSGNGVKVVVGEGRLVEDMNASQSEGQLGEDCETEVKVEPERRVIPVECIDKCQPGQSVEHVCELCIDHYSSPDVPHKEETGVPIGCRYICEVSPEGNEESCQECLEYFRTTR